MVGIFRGVLIFVIFVVDLAGTKFSHPRKLIPTMIWWWAWPQTSWQRGQHFPILASNSSHCHPADSVFDTDILLSHAFCPSLCRIWLSIKQRRSRDHRLCRSATPLDWLLSRNLKPRKLILRAFFYFPRKLDPTKITRHTVCKSVPFLNLYTHMLYFKSCRKMYLQIIVILR